MSECHECHLFARRRRYTRYIGDWSSDVCSSDLGQIEFACDEVNHGGKVAVGAIAAGFGLGGLDEAVNAFEDCVVDAGDEPAQDAILMATDGFSDVDDSRDAAVGGPEVPLVEEGFGLVGGLGEEVLEGEADLVGAGGFQMGVDDV